MPKRKKPSMPGYKWPIPAAMKNEQAPATDVPGGQQGAEDKLGSSDAPMEEIKLMEPFTEEEARARWPHRYQIEQMGSDEANSSRSNGNESDEMMKARCHYTKALVDGIEYRLLDNALVQSEEGKSDYICKIIELFQGIDNAMYFRACWFYRVEDIGISEDYRKLKEADKMVFLSIIGNDNNLDCLLKPLKIAYIPYGVDAEVKKNIIEAYDFYYDEMFLPDHVEVPCQDVPPMDAPSKDSDVSATPIEDSGLMKSKVENQLMAKMFEYLLRRMWMTRMADDMKLP